ncbi:MAG: hypothetical protein JWO58_3124 [Chitinophagaceae bacterium]|nr:hypothetical protein [Chitinophagaceae bacterium]
MKKYCNAKGITLGVVSWMACALSSAYAQNGTTTNQREYNVKNSQWTEINIQGVISKKFNYQLDVQYRRQSDQVQPKQTFDPNLTNIFKNPYQTVFRPWVHFFPMESRKLRLSVSPIGWWSTTGNGEDGYNGAVKNPSETDMNATYMYPEIRSTLQLTTYDQLGRVRMQYRARYELRWLGNGEESTKVGGSGWDIFNSTLHHNTFKTRMRALVRADIALKGQTIDANEFYVAASNEIFIGMGYKTAEGSLVDQNRAYLGVGYKFRKDTRIEIGYLNQMNPKAPVYDATTNTSTSQVDFNNVLHVLVMFDNFNKFFEKKIITPPAEK